MEASPQSCNSRLGPSNCQTPVGSPGDHIRGRKREAATRRPSPHVETGRLPLLASSGATEGGGSILSKDESTREKAGVHGEGGRRNRGPSARGHPAVENANSRSQAGCPSILV